MRSRRGRQIMRQHCIDYSMGWQQWIWCSQHKRLASHWLILEIRERCHSPMTPSWLKWLSQWQQTSNKVQRRIGLLDYSRGWRPDVNSMLWHRKLVGSWRYRNFEDSAESGKPTKADSLRLDDLLWLFSEASEVKHVQCKGGARPNSCGDTLEEDEDSRGVVCDVRVVAQG